LGPRDTGSGLSELDCELVPFKTISDGFNGIMRHGGANPEGVDVLFQPGESLERRRRAEVGRSGMAFVLVFVAI